jgi:hypothetical protein
MSLPENVSGKFDVYPSDGRYARRQLYEFQFRPISLQDILSLAFAYGFAVLYFLMSLSKLRAVKSKIGLIITIVTQIAFSILSSFTPTGGVSSRRIIHELGEYFPTYKCRHPNTFRG